MNTIEQLLQQLHDTASASAQMELALSESPGDEIYRVNADAIRKRQNDLERRLNTELKVSQSDLVKYHIQRAGSDRYPVLAVATAISRFQELVTAVFDALRSTPKQRYRPSPESIALSTLDFAMALPTGSVMVCLSVANDRLLAVKSDLDRTFDEVFQILKMEGSEGLREIAARVGIASIAKAHDWAASASEYGISTKISVQKDIDNSVELDVTNSEALKLKEFIEEKSDQKYDTETTIGELVGIDVERPRTYFHLKADDGKIIEGKLADTFPLDREWAVHVHYFAKLIRVTTIRYATGEEKIEWLLAELAPPALK